MITLDEIFIAYDNRYGLSESDKDLIRDWLEQQGGLTLNATIDDIVEYLYTYLESNR